MPVIPVRTSGGGSYQITIESGLCERMGDHVARAFNAKPHEGPRILLVIDEAVRSTHGAVVARSLQQAGLHVASAEVVAREEEKSIATVERLWKAMAGAGLDRSSAVVAVGGGITGDVSGFAAATYMRGIPIVHAPTTLLAMVDAAIGGKTAVNMMLDAHHIMLKNAVGAFWQPAAVLIDPNVLTTLDARECACGLAECVKHAMIAEASLLPFIVENLHALRDGDARRLEQLISRSAGIKVAIVQEDEREVGRRALLNLGHTFGHALESDSSLGLKHGEAVAIGLCAASWCAVQLGMMDEVERVIVAHTLERCGLPVCVGGSVNVERLMAAMQHDKKSRHGRMTLVLPRGLGSAEVLHDVDKTLVRSAWLHAGAQP